MRSQSGSLEVVATLVRDPAPVEFERLRERRRRLGQGVLDEVWEGVHHMNPAPAGRHADIAQQLAELLGSPARKAGLVPMLSIFNLGEPDDYRVPDGGLHRERENHVYHPTVAMAVEIVSPDDETWDKLGFYASRGVDELLIVEPRTATCTGWHSGPWRIPPAGDQRTDRARRRRARGSDRLARVDAGRPVASDWPE